MPLPTLPPTHIYAPRWWRACTFVLWGGRLAERFTAVPPLPSGGPQALVAMQQCEHCVEWLGPGDVAGICQDCWEEVCEEEQHQQVLSVPAVRYLDYVLKQVKLKLKAKSKQTRLPLGPFTLESLKELRKYILQKFDYQDMSDVEIVQTQGQRGGAGKKGWELRFSLDVVFGPAFIDDNDLNSHLHVAGAGNLFGTDVFTGWVTACFKLQASNRRGTKDTSLVFIATAGSISEHGFAWALGRVQPRRVVYQHHLARQVLHINQARMYSNAAIKTALAAGATSIAAPFPMLPMPFLRRAFLEAGITAQVVPAASAASADAG